MNSYIITDTSASIVLDREVFIVNSNNPNWSKLKDALREKNWDQVEKLISLKKTITVWGNGLLSINGDIITLNGEHVADTSITNRILSMIREGFDVTPLANFLVRLSKNPSAKAREQAYQWLEKNNFAFHPDGRVWGYKILRPDYYDHHSGKVLQSPGMVVSMDRSKVDDDSNRTCSYGLHVAGMGYIPYYGQGDSRIVSVLYDPADIVSVPNDADGTKLRVASYTVVKDLGSKDEFMARNGDHYHRVAVADGSDYYGASGADVDNRTDYERGYDDGLNGDDFDTDYAGNEDYALGYAAGQND